MKRAALTRLGDGTYSGEHCGIAFAVTRVITDDNRTAWYWRIESRGQGGEDWYLTRRDAIAAVRDWIETTRPTCGDCGEHTDDDGACGACVNCGHPLCAHHERFDGNRDGNTCPDRASLRGAS